MIPILSGVLGLAVAFVIVLLMRKDRLHASHGLGWVVIAAGFALLGFAPGIFDYAARFFDIAYPPILGVMLGMSVLVVKMLLIDLQHSRLQLRNQRLVQRIAMLEADLRELRRLRGSENGAQ